MNDQTSRAVYWTTLETLMDDSSRKSPASSRLSSRTTMILVGLVVAFVLLQPSLERWSGIELPDFVDDSGQVVEKAHSQPIESESASERGDIGPDSTRPEVPSSDDPTSKLGELRESDNRVFVSTAGLRYRPGSQEGHRIDHVLRHANEDRSRPVHGVFDGDRDEIFAIIDEAYLITQERGPPNATSDQQDGRTVWTIDLGRRIGYVGGQTGERSHHPAAQHLKLILENGTNVVSAYPVRVLGR